MTEQPLGEVEYRTARQIGVDYPNRTIELVVMPYDQEALVPWQGRMVTETFARGAFDGIERRANRVKVNRDHDVTRTVGKAVAFHPSREEGLVAEIRIARTELGEETLALADDEILDASAGFLPMPGGERWPARDQRRIERAWLAHIAMTPEPAYQGARVLAVRSQTSEPSGRVLTPNLDRVRALLLADEYDRLNR